MIINFSRTLPIVLASAGLAFSSALAVADQKASDMSEVRIEAARHVTAKRIGQSATTGAPIEIVQLTRRVNYSDLDLATHVGALELENRIKATAREACRQLDMLYPYGTEEGMGTQGLHCVDDATGGAMLQARTAIAAAEQRARRPDATHS